MQCHLSRFVRIGWMLAGLGPLACGAPSSVAPDSQGWGPIPNQHAVLAVRARTATGTVVGISQLVFSVDRPAVETINPTYVVLATSTDSAGRIVQPIQRQVALVNGTTPNVPDTVTARVTATVGVRTLAGTVVLRFGPLADAAPVAALELTDGG